MNELEEKFYETGVVPVVYWKMQRMQCRLHRHWSKETFECGSDLPHRSSRGVHPPDDGGFSTDAGGSRHSAYEGAGRCGCSSRCKVYRKSGI